MPHPSDDDKIGIATIIDNRNTVETAQTIKKNKIYQDYKTALEMDISNKQIQDATQAVDENFLNDLMVNTRSVYIPEFDEEKIFIKE